MDHELKENTIQMLGIDIGTFVLRSVVLNKEGHIIWKRSVPHKNKVKKALSKILDGLGGGEYSIGICGSDCPHAPHIKRCGRQLPVEP